MNPPANNPQARSPLRLAAHTRLLIFAATALVVFLAGLYCWPTGVRGYVAQAMLAVRAEQIGAASTQLPSLGDQNSAREVILSAETLREALGQAGPPPNVARGAGEAFPSDAEIEFVRKHLSVARDSATDAEGIRLLLSYAGHDSVWSVAFLDRLAGQTVAALDRRAAEEIALALAGQTESPLQLAERREDAARAALDGFLTRHFDALNYGETPVQGHAKLRRSPSDSEPRPALPMQTKINPKWQSLQDRLAAEASKRDQLLLDRLPEHPQVREANVRIEALQRQLDKTPKFLSDEPLPASDRSAARRNAPSAVQPAQFAQEASTTQPASGSAPVPEVGDEYERLLGELTEAREARKAAERLAEARLLAEPAQASATVLRGKIVADARLAQTLREAPSTGRLTVLALISVFAGACLAALIRMPGKSPTYTTVAEVEADLSLPVVGVVSTASPSAAVLSR
jgi:hypothetical protein